MLLASFTQVHLAIADVDLRVDIHFAYRADRSRELHEHLITVLLHRRAPSLLGASTSLRFRWLRIGSSSPHNTVWTFAETDGGTAVRFAPRRLGNGLKGLAETCPGNPMHPN
jgi:hypothetical protein